MTTAVTLVSLVNLRHPRDLMSHIPKGTLYIYKVSLREVARGVAQKRKGKHPAWDDYHYAGSSRIRIVLIYTNGPGISGQGGTFCFAYLECTVRLGDTLWSYVMLGILCSIIS